MTLTHINTKPSTLKDLRLQFHMSQGDLAMEAGCSRHAVLRNEQLCYPTPLPGIISALSDVSGILEEKLVSAYNDDVVLNRINSRANVFYSESDQLNTFAKANTYQGRLHPFEVWRMALFELRDLVTSRIYFCSAVTVHPAILGRYENFNSGFPTPLDVALQQCGVSEEIMQQFRSNVKFNVVHD